MTLAEPQGKASLAAVGITDGDELSVTVLAEVCVTRYIYFSDEEFAAADEVFLNRSLPLCEQWAALVDWRFSRDFDPTVRLMATTDEGAPEYWNECRCFGELTADELRAPGEIFNELNTICMCVAIQEGLHEDVDLDVANLLPCFW